MAQKIRRIQLGATIIEQLVELKDADPVKPAKKTKKAEAPKVEPVAPTPEPAPQKSFLESAVEAVKPKRRGRQKKPHRQHHKGR